MPTPAVPVPVPAASADLSLVLGPYLARIGTAHDLRRTAQGLRDQAFAPRGGTDSDAFDDPSLHGLVSHVASDTPCVAFRVRIFDRPADLAQSYTAQSYDLTPLTRLGGAVLELGRLCQSSRHPHPAALRAAWAALTALADRHAVTLLIGCSSFPGSDPRHHAAALASLRAHHLGPVSLRPGRRADLAVDLPGPEVTPGPLPPLLRSYLAMGGWVGDHAVRDPALDTLHVFTGLRVADIPDIRRDRLRALVRRATSVPPLDVARAAP